MQGRDQEKKQKSNPAGGGGGGEGNGVHVCNKCRWPFSNAHPSQKKRAAHKKHCGKIEGYPLVVSTGERVEEGSLVRDFSSVTINCEEMVLEQENNLKVSAMIKPESFEEGGASKDKKLDKSEEFQDNMSLDCPTDAACSTEILHPIQPNGDLVLAQKSIHEKESAVDLEGDEIPCIITSTMLPEYTASKLNGIDIKLLHVPEEGKTEPGGECQLSFTSSHHAVSSCSSVIVASSGDVTKNNKIGATCENLSDYLLSSKTNTSGMEIESPEHAKPSFFTISGAESLIQPVNQWENDLKGVQLDNIPLPCLPGPVIHLDEEENRKRVIALSNNPEAHNGGENPGFFSDILELYIAEIPVSKQNDVLKDISCDNSAAEVQLDGHRAMSNDAITSSILLQVDEEEDSLGKVESCLDLSPDISCQNDIQTQNFIFDHAESCVVQEKLVFHTNNASDYSKNDSHASQECEQEEMENNKKSCIESCSNKHNDKDDLFCHEGTTDLVHDTLNDNDIYSLASGECGEEGIKNIPKLDSLFCHEGATDLVHDTLNDNDIDSLASGECGEEGIKNIPKLDDLFCHEGTVELVHDPLNDNNIDSLASGECGEEGIKNIPKLDDLFCHEGTADLVHDTLNDNNIDSLASGECGEEGIKNIPKLCVESGFDTNTEEGNALCHGSVYSIGNDTGNESLVSQQFEVKKMQNNQKLYLESVYYTHANEENEFKRMKPIKNTVCPNIDVTGNQLESTSDVGFTLHDIDVDNTQNKSMPTAADAYVSFTSEMELRTGRDDKNNLFFHGGTDIGYVALNDKEIGSLASGECGGSVFYAHTNEENEFKRKEPTERTVYPNIDITRNQLESKFDVGFTLHDIDMDNTQKKSMLTTADAYISFTSEKEAEIGRDESESPNGHLNHKHGAQVGKDHNYQMLPMANICGDQSKTILPFQDSNSCKEADTCTISEDVSSSKENQSLINNFPYNEKNYSDDLIFVDTSDGTVDQRECTEGYYVRKCGCSLSGLAEKLGTGCVTNSSSYTANASSLTDVPSDPSRIETGQQLTLEICPIDTGEQSISVLRDANLSLQNKANESQGFIKKDDIKSRLAVLQHSNDGIVESSKKKPHVPLKNLLGEANQEGMNNLENFVFSPYEESDTLENGCSIKNIQKSTCESECSPVRVDARVMQKEWNSPARLPVKKNTKGKTKGKPHWTPFMCCSSNVI